MSAQHTPMFNVVARRLDNGATRFIAENKTERNAEAIVQMAVARRGVDEECFYIEPIAKATGGDDPLDEAIEKNGGRTWI